MVMFHIANPINQWFRDIYMDALCNSRNILEIAESALEENTPLRADDLTSDDGIAKLKMTFLNVSFALR